MNIEERQNEDGQKDPQKEAWMAGSQAGVQLGFELALRAIEAQMKEVGIQRMEFGTKNPEPT